MKAICASVNFDRFMVLPRPTARISRAAKLEFSSNLRSRKPEAGHKKRVTIFLRARGGRSPCCGKQFAHLKAKSPPPNPAQRRRINQKLAKLPNQVCRR